MEHGMSPGTSEGGGRMTFQGQVTGDQDGKMRVWPCRAGQDDGDGAMLPLVHGGLVKCEMEAWLRDHSNSAGPQC